MTNCCASTNSLQNSRNLLILIHYLHLDQNLDNGLSNQESPGWYQLTSYLYGAYSLVYCDYRRVKLSFTRLTFKQTDRPSGTLPTGTDPSLHKISLVRQSSTLGRTIYSEQKKNKENTQTKQLEISDPKPINMVDYTPPQTNGKKKQPYPESLSPSTNNYDIFVESQ